VSEGRQGTLAAKAEVEIEVEAPLVVLLMDS
jgi:hypothetical protein